MDTQLKNKFVILCLVFLLSVNIFAEEKIEVDLGAVDMTELISKLRPSSLSFKDLEKQVATYLAKIPEDKRAVETKRLAIVKNFKALVKKIISRKEYKGKIYLGKSIFRGSITAAQDDSMTVLVKGKGTKDLAWSKFHLRQYADIFITDVMTKVAGLTSTNRQDSERVFVKAANYYYALAIFYDWYGMKSAAKIYRRSSLTLNPIMKEKLDLMLPLL
jgi:hypothetical protein